MSMFKNMTTDGLENQGDVLGGFKVHESDAYEAMVKVAYAGASASGAQFIGIHLTLSDGSEYRENVYFTNRQGENFYLDRQTGNKKILPGMQTVDEMCQLITGEPLASQETEEKVIKLWDSEAKAETNQSVPVLTSLTGEKIIVGILKQIVDKTEKDGNGNYVPTGETREENTISKFFRAEDQGTVSEHMNDAKLGVFFEEWVAKNKGNTINRAKGAGAGSGASGRPGQSSAQGGANKAKSLFKR